MMRMPVLFIGHGSPVNALGGSYAAIWRAVGAALPRPRAILCVSAHWYVPETAVTADAAPRTIHDFGDFGPELFAMRYPAPGDPALALRVAAILAPVPVRQALDWGLDHGAWSVLVHLFPEADVPVVQLSVDQTKPAAFHYETGRRLAALREEGVLIVATGDVVHNLRAVRWQGGEAIDWAARFQTLVKERIAARDDQALIDWQHLGDDARLSIPTPEHYLPLLYALGASGADEPLRFFAEQIDLGSISMLGVRFG